METLQNLFLEDIAQLPESSIKNNLKEHIDEFVCLLKKYKLPFPRVYEEKLDDKDFWITLDFGTNSKKQSLLVLYDEKDVQVEWSEVIRTPTSEEQTRIFDSLRNPVCIAYIHFRLSELHHECTPAQHSTKRNVTWL